MNNQKKNKQEFKVPKRLRSLDVLRGISIVIAVFFIHLSADFLSNDWIFINTLYFPFADFIGPLFFVFISGIASVVSIKQKEGKIPNKVIRNRIIARGLFIMGIGAIINVFHNILYPISLYSPIPFPLSMWGWNILFFIGFAQIVAYYAYKWGITISTIIGILIIFIGVPLREIIYMINFEIVNQNNFNLFYFLLQFIITSPIPQIPLFPCIAVSFFSTTITKMVYSQILKENRRQMIKILKIFTISAILIIGFSVFFGYTILTPDPLTSKLYPEVNLIYTTNTQNIIPEFELLGLSAFLIRGTITHTTFAIGFSLLTFTISFYYLDLKKRINLISRFFEYYGKYSLSFFLFVFYFDFAFHRFLNIYFFLIYYFAVISLLGFIIFIWKKYSKDAFLTPEWIVGKICVITANQTYKRLNKKQQEKISVSRIK
ncbi:MAG: hypothetical protein EU547_06755 [Promethearchaeota archaeon]|nr:MAG: hypothetical protein EU547_06755 [Candidatus Lokiarchaeota archaeon]